LGAALPASAPCRAAPGCRVAPLVGRGGNGVSRCIGVFRPTTIISGEIDVDDPTEEFETLGQEQVHKRLAASIWSSEKSALARQWLEFRSTAIPREANDLARTANAAAEEANSIARDAAASARQSAEAARTNNIIATLALIGAVIAIAISIIGLFLHRMTVHLLRAAS
jgi:hypothetical protein